MWVALTKYHRLGGLQTTEIVFSHSSGRVLVRALFQDADGWLLTVSHMCILSHIGSCVGPVLQIHEAHSSGFHPQDLSTSQMPYLQMLSHWALGFQHVNGWGVQIFGP